MTTQITYPFCGLLASILLISNSFAQTSDFSNLQPVLVKGTYDKVYKNILDGFHKQFENAQNVKWFKRDKNFLVNFFMDDQIHTALLNPKADLIYQISYGKEKHLPVDIRKAVNRWYLEYSITSVTKFQVEGRSIWVIQIEDDTNFVVVRIENDELEEVKKYRKSKLQFTPQVGIVKQ